MAENNIENNLKMLWGHSIRQGTWKQNVQGTKKLSNGWVPTSHNFTEGIEIYFEYRSANPALKMSYRKWLQDHKSVKHFWYIANSHEFNLNSRHTDIIRQLYKFETSNDKQAALEFLSIYRENAINNNDFSWDKFPKYIMDTFFSGQLANHNAEDRAKILVDHLYAGTIEPEANKAT
jgi:hypothetical protein